MHLPRPNGKKPISQADDEIISSTGLAVVECSWARLDEIPFGKLKSPNERLRAFFAVHPASHLVDERSSAISIRHQSGQLWSAVAAELCRSFGRSILHYGS